MPDEQLKDVVVARLSGHPGVRFATVAANAQAVGRRGLAALLLEYETCAAEQARQNLGLSSMSILHCHHYAWLWHAAGALPGLHWGAVPAALRRLMLCPPGYYGTSVAAAWKVCPGRFPLMTYADVAGPAAAGPGRSGRWALP